MATPGCGLPVESGISFKKCEFGPHLRWYQSDRTSRRMTTASRAARVISLLAVMNLAAGCQVQIQAVKATLMSWVFRLRGGMQSTTSRCLRAATSSSSRASSFTCQFGSNWAGSMWGHAIRKKS